MLIERRLGDEKTLEQGGAGCVLLRNTMHKLYDSIVPRVHSVFHIADTLGHALAADGLTRAGQGTRTTMVEDFFATRLRDGFDEVITWTRDRSRQSTPLFSTNYAAVVRDGCTPTLKSWMTSHRAGRKACARLHRDRDAGEAATPGPAAVRHDAPACPSRRGMGAFGRVTISDGRRARLC